MHLPHQVLPPYGIEAALLQFDYERFPLLAEGTVARIARYRIGLADEPSDRLLAAVLLRGESKRRHEGSLGRPGQTIIVNPKSGLGDVLADIEGRSYVAECKGGVINSKHAGQLFRLRKGYARLSCCP